MKSLIIAYRTLRRNRRRLILTTTLIAVGVLFVLLFAAFSGSFKSYMIGQITDSMLGHLQIHRKGYVASLDNMPLDKNFSPQQLEKIQKSLAGIEGIASTSLRLRHSALISNFDTSTNVRLNGIDPAREHATLPLFRSRIEGNGNLRPGEVLIPDIVAKGMKLGIGDTVVLVVTNGVGSMNARTFKVAGILHSISGPGGRDGYLHIDDSRALLRLSTPEANEIAIRLSDLSALPKINRALKAAMGEESPFEVHDWQALSPFSSIAKMIDLMSLSVQIVLVAIVLISILNVMIMSVYERLREIGTMSAIGTPPAFIIAAFVAEGVILGLIGFGGGTLVSYAVVLGIGDLSVSFGREDDILLSPALHLSQVALVGFLVTLIAALASLYPALKAARMNPVDALRS